MFVGDGINDSPVLAQADVGAAINSASDITVSAAGIVFVKDDLRDVLRALLVASKTYQRIKINFLFAFLYNTILIPVAMGFFYPIGKFKLDPMFAAVAMALSSISVVSSSLLLRCYDPNSDLTENYEPMKTAKVFNDTSVATVLSEPNEGDIRSEMESKEFSIDPRVQTD